MKDIPSSGLLDWMPPTGWQKIKAMPMATYATLLEIAGIVGHDPWMLGMSSEIISIWRKPICDSRMVADPEP